MTQPAAGPRPHPSAVVLAVGGLYVGQSIISGVTFTGLPALLRERGLALDMIGLAYLAALPWALKFLWAPAVERYRLPAAGTGRSRIIVVAGGLVSALGLVLVGLVGPADIGVLIAVVMTMAFAAATVDIACDGYAVENLARRHYGWGNAAQVGGAYLGAAIGSGLYLVLVARLDWSAAAFIMAGLVVLLGLPFVVSAEHRRAGTRPHRPSLGHALRRPQMRWGLLLAAIFVAAQKWGVVMLGPFLIDSGVSVAVLGIVNGVGALCIGVAGALIGGALVRWLGARPVMVLALATQALLLAALAAVASAGVTFQPILFGLALASSSGIMAIGFVALYSRFMALADPNQAGIDFTLLQCMDALVSMAGGLSAGWLAEHLGFGPYFTAAAVLAFVAAPAVFLLGREPGPEHTP